MHEGVLLKDYYAVLGLKPDASRDTIKKAYRKMARKYHPDIYDGHDAETRFDEVSDAYQVLGDPLKRRAYDRKIREERRKRGDELDEVHFPSKFSKTRAGRVGRVGVTRPDARDQGADFDRFGELSQMWQDRFVHQHHSYTEGAKRSYGERYSKIPRYRSRRFVVREKKRYDRQGPVSYKSYEGIRRERHGTTGHSGIVKRSYAYMERDTGFSVEDESMFDDIADQMAGTISKKSNLALAVVLLTFFGLMAFILVMILQ